VTTEIERWLWERDKQIQPRAIGGGFTVHQRQNILDPKPRGPGFDSPHYQIFRVALCLEWGPLSPCEDNRGAT
jgi:hypothetical protein